MYHDLSLKNPYELFNTNVFIDLNDKLCQDKGDDMFEQVILDNYATKHLMQKTNKSRPTEFIPTKNISTCINTTTYSMSWLNMEKIWLISWCLFLTKGPHWTCARLRTRTPSSISGRLCPWRNNQKGSPTHGWYGNSWRMWCLQVSLDLLHCFQKRWLRQTNF